MHCPPSLPRLAAAAAAVALAACNDPAAPSAAPRPPAAAPAAAIGQPDPWTLITIHAEVRRTNGVTPYGGTTLAYGRTNSGNYARLLDNAPGDRDPRPGHFAVRVGVGQPPTRSAGPRPSRTASGTW
jgi:hypothetical protein